MAGNTSAQGVQPSWTTACSCSVMAGTTIICVAPITLGTCHKTRRMGFMANFPKRLCSLKAIQRRTRPDTNLARSARSSCATSWCTTSLTRIRITVKLTRTWPSSRPSRTLSAISIKLSNVRPHTRRSSPSHSSRSGSRSGHSSASGAEFCSAIKL